MYRNLLQNSNVKIFVLQSERRVSNYFVSIIMACEGRGGGRANRFFGERVERPVLGCKLRTLEASQLNVKLHGALYSTIDIRRGLGHGRLQGGGREGVQE